MGDFQTIASLIDLSGNRGIVTGGLKGIGQAITARLVESGAKVLVADSDPSINEIKDTEQISYKYCDITDQNDLSSTIQSASDNTGIDFLVNNAGIFPTTGPIEQVTDEFVSRMLEVNVRAQYSASREAANHLRKGGAIVHIASIAALRGGANISAYSTSKAAVHHLTRVMAAKLVKENILVNAIAPGPYPSQMLGSAVEHDYSETARKNPRNRVGLPEDIAGLAIFLCSQAGSYIVGETIASDGGIVKTAGHNLG